MKIVKALVLTLIMAMSLVIVSCQEDEDLIVGKWRLIELSGDNVEGNNDLLGTKGSIFEFTSDKKLRFSVNGFNVSASYTIGDNKITTTWMGRTNIFDIEKLSRKDLHISYTSEYGLTKAQFERQ